jgi:LPXTG-site transpeptidase (sortase) family protein
VTTSTVAWSSLSLDDQSVEREPAPIGLAIEAIGVVAPVVALGVATETGQMEVPENIDEVGWYRFGPTPGQAGSSVLAAHVDMYGEGPGVFFNLDLLTAGDRIEVRFADGEVSTFLVTTTERVAKASLAVDELFATEGRPTLRLITCGGGFNRTTRAYDDNIVVTAEPEVP